MAVHHDKLLKFLKDHSIPERCSDDGTHRDRINWLYVGPDPGSVAGAFRFLADEIEAGVFD